MSRRRCPFWGFATQLCVRRGFAGQSRAAIKNRLFYGDNLDVLGRHMTDQSVDLIYLDPPFKSEQYRNVLFAGVNAGRWAESGHNQKLEEIE